MPYHFFLFTIFLLFVSCQNDSTNSKSLNVYVETPALYHALAIYQKEVDEKPFSIHLRHGLEQFFQLSGTERPVKKNTSEEQDKLDQDILRLTLGGGLYLSSELPQMDELETYLRKLPKELGKLRQENGAYPISSQFASEYDSEYLVPILLYPKLSQIMGLPQNIANTENQVSSPLYRLLSPSWLATQLLPGKSSNPVFLQSPGQVLLEYLRNSPLEFHFTPEGFSSNQALLPKEYQEFIRNYRSLLAQLKNNEEGEGNGEEDNNKPQLHDAGAIFARQQQKLYEDIPQDLKLAHRDAGLRLESASFPYLYFTGQLQTEQEDVEENQNSGKQNLELELDKILWGAINKGLSREHYQQALKILTWLQSPEGQATLQLKLPQLDSDTTLGIFRAMSLYPEVNSDFWHSLQLDWPWTFAISWVLPAPLIKWQPELFQGVSFGKEQLYYNQSAKSVAYNFLLPYLFLPEQASTVEDDAKDSAGGDKQNNREKILDWSLWLQAN